jgi:predicted O-methyltransferase YrrM
LIFNFFRVGSVSNVRKRKFISNQALKYDLDTIVETGTYFGHSTIYFSKKFTKVFTIEISDNLYDFAARRFLKRKKFF